MGISELASSLEGRRGNPYADVVPGMVLHWEERRGARYVVVDPKKMVELNGVAMIDRQEALQEIRDRFDPLHWRPPFAVKVKGRQDDGEVEFMAPYDGHMRTRAAAENPEIVRQVGVKGGIEYQDMTQKAFGTLKVDGKGRDYLTPVEYAKLVNTGIYKQEEVAGLRKAAHVMIAWEQQLKPQDSDLSGLAAMELLRRDLDDPRSLILRTLSKGEQSAISTLRTLVTAGYGMNPSDCLAEAFWVTAKNRESLERAGGSRRQLIGIFNTPEVREKLDKVYENDHRLRSRDVTIVVHQLMALMGTVDSKNEARNLLGGFMADIRRDDMSWGELRQLVLSSRTHKDYNDEVMRLKKEKAYLRFEHQYLRLYVKGRDVGKGVRAKGERSELDPFERKALRNFSGMHNSESSLHYLGHFMKMEREAKELVMQWEAAKIKMKNKFGVVTEPYSLAIADVDQKILEVRQFADNSNPFNGNYLKFKVVVDDLGGSLARHERNIQETNYLNVVLQRIFNGASEETADPTIVRKLQVLVKNYFTHALDRSRQRNRRIEPNYQDMRNATISAGEELVKELVLVIEHSKPNLMLVLDGRITFDHALNEARKYKAEKTRQARDVGEERKNIEWLRQFASSAQKLDIELSKPGEIPEDVRRGLLEELTVLRKHEPELRAVDKLRQEGVTKKIVDEQGDLYDASKGR